MLDVYKINKSRVQQFGLTATIKDDSGQEHYFHNGYEYIEIGGIKWAVTNIGANTEIDSGLYFAFGEKQGYTVEQMLKGERKFSPNDYVNVNFDAVNAYWGGKWRLPTDYDLYNFFKATTNRWVENYQGSEVNGRLFVDKTDSSKKLFFPAFGHCRNGNVYNVGFSGDYWTSSFYTRVVTYGKCLYFSRITFAMYSDWCYCGFSIRGVVGE